MFAQMRATTTGHCSSRRQVVHLSHPWPACEFETHDIIGEGDAVGQLTGMFQKHCSIAVSPLRQYDQWSCRLNECRWRNEGMTCTVPRKDVDWNCRNAGSATQPAIFCLWGDLDPAMPILRYET